jgi:hypothetical protein
MQIAQFALNAVHCSLAVIWQCGSEDSPLVSDVLCAQICFVDTDVIPCAQWMYVANVICKFTCRLRSHMHSHASRKT